MYTRSRCGTAEFGRKYRVLLVWHLEHANADRAAALQAEELHATQLDREMGRFEAAVSYICHELRNPLHGVFGTLDALADGAMSRVMIARAALRLDVPI